MKRIDLLNFGSQIFSDDHLALPVTSYAQNTWETGIARIINTAIFMTQLLESRKNSTDLSHYKFTAEEEKIYSVISQKIPGIKLPEKVSLSEYLLERVKKQLTESMSQWSNVADDFPAKIKCQQLLSMLLNSQNILAGSFPNYLLKDPAPAVLECMFGMLRIEIVIQSAIMKSQKDLSAHCELEKLLEVVRDSTLYNHEPLGTVTLKQILQINSKWTGTFSDWGFGVPQALTNLVDTNQNPVFNSLVREELLATESKIIKVESLLIDELALEIKQHQDKIRQRFDKLKGKMSDTNALNLDEYLRVGTEQIQKFEKYKSSLSSSAAAVSAFIKTFLDFHGQNFPTWGEINQKPLQEIKTITNSLNSTAIKLSVMPKNTGKPRPPQTPKEIKEISVTPILSSSVSPVTESLSAPLTVSKPLITSASEKVNPTPDAKKTSTPTEVVTEGSKTIETSTSPEISLESKKTEVSGSTQLVETSSVSSDSQKNNLEEKETIGVSTTPVKPAIPTLEKSPSSVRVTPIPAGASLAKRASVFQQSSSSSSSSTSTSSISSTQRGSKISNLNFEALKKAVIIPATPGTATQALIQKTQNKGFIGSGTTGSTTTTSSSSSSSPQVIGKG